MDTESYEFLGRDNKKKSSTNKEEGGSMKGIEGLC